MVRMPEMMDVAAKSFFPECCIDLDDQSSQKFPIRLRRDRDLDFPDMRGLWDVFLQNHMLVAGFNTFFNDHSELRPRQSGKQTLAHEILVVLVS